jgi:4a-hydroxytetrahydrobiopterin dehydratase
MKTKSAKTHCVPCETLTRPLKGAALRAARQRLGSEWKILRQRQLERTYAFPDFRTALAFANRVGKLAEKEGHHPDITISWGQVRLTLWTHSIGGLSDNDFILAAKADQVV